MKYLIATFLLLFTESICYADVQASSNEIGFMDAVADAYSEGDEDHLKKLIERRLTNEGGDVLGLALHVNYFALFEPQSEQFRLSIDALYQRTEKVQGMRQAVDEFLKPAKAILKNVAMDDYKGQSLIDGFPFHENVGKDPIFLMFFRSAEGLQMVYESRLEHPLDEHQSLDQKLISSGAPQDLKDSTAAFGEAAVKAVEEVALPEPAIEQPAEVVAIEDLEVPVEKSSNWWLWLIGAVVVLGGAGLVIRRKS